MSSTVLPSLPAAADSILESGGQADLQRVRGAGFVRVVLFVVIAFGGMEVFTRASLFKASKDISRFQTFPERVTALHAAGGTRIAFVGNSLSERGIDPRLFATSLRDFGGGLVAADLFCADASKINVWHYLANRYFYRPSQAPDVLIVSYYENNLIDGNRLEIGRFAQFFVDVTDWPEVFQNELTDSKQRLDFLLSSVWATYAASDRIKERVLGLAIPDYQDLTVRHNEVTRNAHSEVPTMSTVTHRALNRFVARAQAHGVKVIFVAAPTIIPGKTPPYMPYKLNPDTLDLIRQAGMEFVDLRQVPGLTHDLFADDIHLNAEGRELYTRYLAQTLAPTIRRLVGSGSQRSSRVD